MTIAFIVLYLLAAFTVAAVATEGFARGSVWRALGVAVAWPLFVIVFLFGWAYEGR